jgi:hypothetical protein
VRLFWFWLWAPGLLLGQVPRIGVIDFYGLRKVPEARLRSALGVGEGDALPRSKADVEERIERVPGVVQARLEAVCCEGDRAILYVGIQEKGAPHFDFRLPPNSDVSLPPDLVETYRKFLEAFERVARGSTVAEDLTQGYSLMADPEGRALQEQFRAFAERNVELLHEVLREAKDDEQRAVAACVIGYAPKKRGVVSDLLYAMQDAYDDVRANAMRALGAIAVLAAREPDSDLRISPTWFIEMLNSIVWNDRRRAATALVNLTETRNPGILGQLRERALPSLVEMAQWKTLAHALPAYLVLGRIAGLSEKDIQEAWSKGERGALIQRARSLVSK